MTCAPGGIFDAHLDTMLRAESAKSIIEGCEDIHFDVPRGRLAGVRTAVTAICAEAHRNPVEAVEKGLACWRELDTSDSGIQFLLGLEGCEPIAAGYFRDEDIQKLSIASLTWNGMNSLGGGIGADESLTPTGAQLAKRLVRMGILVDVSHLCDRSRSGVLKMGIPAVATHCNCRKLCDIPRNLPDDDLREIAVLGGVVGITFVPDFTGPEADLDLMLDHVLHAVDVAGIEHVGFGSDFDGVGKLPGGIEGCEAWPAILDGLLSRGFREVDINRIAGSNWRRAFNQMRGLH
jgi:membrane dipeptidase